MPDIISEQIKNSQNNPQILTQKEAKELQKEVGDETYQKMIQDNIIAIKELLQNNNKLENKSNKNEEQDKNKKEQDRVKAEQRHQQLISSLRSFSGDIKSSISSITNAGMNKLSDLLGASGSIGKIAQAAFEAARVGVNLSFAIDKMQTQRNIEYLKSHNLNNVYDANFVKSANDFYLKSLDRGIDYGMNPDEVKSANKELQSTINMKNLEDWQQLRTQDDYYKLTNKNVRAVNPEFAELYKTMIGQGGLSSQSAYANLNAFNRSFEFSSLGTERSLQLSKQLFESNRRFNMSMNSAAGYINKFNAELQRGTSTLSDITSVRTTLKTKGSGDLAGLGQMIVNMGLGTPEMNKAAGNPFALASILRRGDPTTIDRLQQTLDNIATSAGFGKGVKGRDEYLRNLYNNFGFSLNEDLLARVTRGSKISAYDLGIKKKPEETLEEAKKREAEEFASLMLEVNKKTVAAGDTYEARMLMLVEKISSQIGEKQDDITSGKTITPLTDPIQWKNEFKRRYKENGFVDTTAQMILGDQLYNMLLKFAFEKGE